MCPITDHRCNGRFERLITITERLKTNKRIVLQKCNTDLSELYYTLRRTPKIDKIATAELQVGRNMTTVKDILTVKPQSNYNVSKIDVNLEFETSDFPEDRGSEILLRERAGG